MTDVLHCTTNSDSMLLDYIKECRMVMKMLTSWCREKVVIPKNKPMLTLLGVGGPIVDVWNDTAFVTKNSTLESRQCYSWNQWQQFHGTHYHVPGNLQALTLQEKITFLNKKCQPHISGNQQVLKTDSSIVLSRMAISHFKICESEGESVQVFVGKMWEYNLVECDMGCAELCTRATSWSCETPGRCTALVVRHRSVLWVRFP